MGTNKLSVSQSIILTCSKQYAKLPNEELQDAGMVLNEGQLTWGLFRVPPERVVKVAGCSMNRLHWLVQ